MTKETMKEFYSFPLSFESPWSYPNTSCTKSTIEIMFPLLLSLSTVILCSFLITSYIYIRFIPRLYHFFLLLFLSILLYIRFSLHKVNNVRKSHSRHNDIKNIAHISSYFWGNMLKRTHIYNSESARVELTLFTIFKIRKQVKQASSITQLVDGGARILSQI